MFRARGDQAAGLRRLFHRNTPTVVSVVGGQTASGTTRIACALALELAARGLTVTLIDEHRNSRGAAAVLGVRFRYDLWQVVNGDVPLRRAAIPVGEHLSFVSAARLAQQREHLDETQRAGLEHSWRRLSADSDVIVIDASGHPGGKFSPLAAKAGVIAVVTGSSSAAVMGSYLTLKSIAQTQRSARLGIVVNRAKDAQQAAYIGDNMRGLIEQQLERSIEYFGFAPVVADWRAGTMPCAYTGIEMAEMFSILSVPSRHDHCIMYDRGNIVEAVGDSFARTAAVAT